MLLSTAEAPKRENDKWDKYLKVTYEILVVYVTAFKFPLPVAREKNVVTI